MPSTVGPRWPITGRSGGGTSWSTPRTGFPYFSPLWRRKPILALVHHVHSDQWDQRFPPALAAVGRFTEARIMPLVYRRVPFVANSPSTRSALESIGVDPGRIHIVHPGVDPPAVTGVARSEEPLFVCAGRLMPHKRVDLLLRVWDRVQPVVGGRLVVLGDGPERASLEAMAGTGVVFAGRVDEQEKWRWLGQAWGLVHSAQHEGWGIVITEAALVGTPSIGFDVPGVRDAIVDGRHRHPGRLRGRTGPALDRDGHGPLRQRAPVRRGEATHSALFGWSKVARRLRGGRRCRPPLGCRPMTVATLEGRRVAEPALPRSSEPHPAPSPDPLSRWVLAGLGAFFLLVTMVQAPGLIVDDTKLPVVMAPLAWMRSSFHLWSLTVSSGSVQDQTFGYLFPMAPFFALTHLLHVPVWWAERVWLALLLTAGTWGMVRLAEALGIGKRWARVLGGIVYCAAPIVVTWAASSATLLAVVLLPWLLQPLVVGSSSGSPRTAAARSGVAVALMGGVNATVVLATLPVGVLWLLTRQRGPRRRSLAAWWVVSLGLACFWWVVPTLLQGKYGYNYVPYTESAATTTSTASAFEALRGASYWTDYYDLGGPLIPGAWTLVTSAAAILGTAVVAALGLAGLARRIPERLFLVACLSVGVVVIAAGYGGTLAGPFSPHVQGWLQGGLAPLRSVAKFSPDVALPLALGLVWLVSTVSSGGVRSPGHDWPAVRADVAHRSPDALLPVALGTAWLRWSGSTAFRRARRSDWPELRSSVARRSPDLLLPLTLGAARLAVAPVGPQAGAAPVPRRVAWNGRGMLAGLVAVVVVVLAAMPFWQRNLYPTGGFAAIPHYWTQAADWIEGHQGEQTTLLVPGAAFGRVHLGKTAGRAPRRAHLHLDHRPLGGAAGVQREHRRAQHGRGRHRHRHGPARAGRVPGQVGHGLRGRAERPRPEGDRVASARRGPSGAERDRRAVRGGLVRAAPPAVAGDPWRAPGVRLVLLRPSPGCRDLPGGPGPGRRRGPDLRRLRPIVVSGSSDSLLPLAGAGVLTGRPAVLARDPDAEGVASAPGGPRGRSPTATSDGPSPSARSTTATRTCSDRASGPGDRSPPIPLDYQVVSGAGTADRLVADRCLLGVRHLGRLLTAVQ